MGECVLSEKMKGIEKDLHNASKGGLLIKNLACNNTRYRGVKGMAIPNNNHSHNSVTTPTCGAVLMT
jgi:hypothetical protein